MKTNIYYIQLFEKYYVLGIRFEHSTLIPRIKGEENVKGKDNKSCIGEYLTQ